ncbi:DUF5317 family protein [Clostridium estertheticum]|uniref:DUF5317 family protein n=1 Tax=Clostridium estertheticum TaxID=238834 RepID=UPI001CF4BF9C|nr:DUF5317 family protein [Clostridium estertheticum]MCB2352963.1 DUF5317 domain-containing protein [Clostridium estertheticum]WAG40265.1 DUF5317 domain-containing protein [Clostridium estertheticum]
MIEPILLALIFAKIKGYKIKPLFKSWAIYPVLIFAILYVILEVMIFNNNYTLIKYNSIYHYLYLLTFIILVIRYKLNISAIIGSILIIIGSILNNIVIAANNGKMPVFPTLSYLTGYVKSDSFMKVKDIHILGSGITKMKFLTDIIDVGYCIMSIGDICIRAFVFIILFNTIKVINKTSITKDETLIE